MILIKKIIFANTVVLCLITSICVLNGLYVEEIPNELSKLNASGRQLVQQVKPFQKIIPLGTYTGKVPIYNATKGLKRGPCSYSLYHYKIPLKLLMIRG